MKSQLTKLKTSLLFFYIITITSQLKVLNITQNQGGLMDLTSKSPELQKNYNKFLTKLTTQIKTENPDIILLQIQELIELKFKFITKTAFNTNILNLLNASENLPTEAQCEKLLKIISSAFKKNNLNYNLGFNLNISMLTIFIIKKNLSFKMQKISAVNKNGGGSQAGFNFGFWGHKGGLITLFSVFDQSDGKVFNVVSVNVHFDAESQGVRRGQFEMLFEEVGRVVGAIQDYFVFFAGDFNSRFTVEEVRSVKGKSVEEAVGIIRESVFDQGNFTEEFKKLISEEFQEFKEMQIGFLPTFKLDFKNNYDTKCYKEENFEKCYTKPKKLNYTDRVFYSVKGKVSITELEYDIYPTSLISDHHTVFAIFEIESSEVNLPEFQSEIFPERNLKLKNFTSLKLIDTIIETHLKYKNDKSEENLNKFLIIAKKEKMTEKISDLWVFMRKTLKWYVFLAGFNDECDKLEGFDIFDKKKQFENFRRLILGFRKCFEMIKDISYSLGIVSNESREFIEIGGKKII